MAGKRSLAKEPKTGRTQDVTRRSLLKLAGLAATGLLASPALVRSARAATVIKIGSIQSLTGPSAPPGISARNGTVLAVQEITKAGGFKDSAGNAYSIELISNDMVSDPRQAILMFRQYAADSAVVASVGPTTSLGFVPNDWFLDTRTPGYGFGSPLVMSFAGISGRYSFAVQAGSTIGPILRNPASIVGGTSAHTSPLSTADVTNAARLPAIT